MAGKQSCRAFQAWPLLTFAAAHHQLLTYEELGLHLGLPSIAVSDTLKLIERYCQKMGRPLLHLIVVGKASGRPNLDIDVDVSKAQAEVFAYGWINHEKHSEGVPTIDHFEQVLTA